MDVEEIDLEEWREALPSTGYEVFHRPEALRVLDSHTDAELRLLAGYKGQQIVGLMPVFCTDRSVGRTVFSPPPSTGVPRLGPLLTSNSPKRRKREAENNEFVELVLDEFDVASRRTLFRVVTPLSYADPRAFVWAGKDVSPNFTYVLDLDDRDPDALLDTYTRDLRTEIRKGDELDVEVRVEGPDAAVRVYRHVIERYGDQDEEFPVSEAFVRDLATALDDRCRTYVARGPDGEYLSGMIVLYSADLAYGWQGGVRADYESVSTNSLVHWAIIADVLEDERLDSIVAYDLVGANTKRLCRYKSKFEGELVPYYAVESTGPEMSLAKSVYNLVGD